MVVLVKNCIYQVPLENQSYSDLEATLCQINGDANKLQTSPHVGVATGVHRDFWTKVRKRLILDLNNAASLQVIESAAFAICLDEKTPQSQQQHAQNMILDDGSNRWYDKTLQIIIFKSGKAGLYAEHSLVDATVVSRVLSDTLAKIEPSS